LTDIPAGVDCDLMVAGFGLAGATAAIEAARAGLGVVVLDRYQGGGASGMSGGLYYAGGGTRQQREAGYDDDPDNMYAYLKTQLGQPAVSDRTLMRFCADSVANLVFLEEQGVEWGSTVWPYRATFPPDGYYLHFTGNESVQPYASAARPVPRGHRAVGEGFTGRVIMERMLASALSYGVRVHRETRVTRLLVEGDRVVGVQFHAGEKPATQEARGRLGVLLATGGYQFDTELVGKHGPVWLAGKPQGMEGDGDGLKLGLSVGAAASHLNHFEGWVSPYPPTSMMRGILVGPNGRRLCSEELYAATLTQAIVNEGGGRSWLIADQAVFDRARAEAAETAGVKTYLDDKFAPSGHTRAGTVAELATAIGVDARGLEAALAEYNRAAAQGTADRFSKSPELVQPLDHAPFYAWKVFFAGRHFMSTGGLVVDEDTGEVQRPDGSAIAGLYAAGRTAVGICTTGYNSGLSLADCVFGGRRVAAHVKSRAGVISAAP
jgi:3-oxo-5alpha-steroid 4-dehydrogenase